MASTVAAEQSLEVPHWLKTLPLAPEYHPTLAEFEDPIAYILKIEKEAWKYGICKIVPPLPPLPKKVVISNLNRSLLLRNHAQNPKPLPTFTTRHQQIGFCPRRPRPVQRPVWQSGENYTVQEFEAKAKHFEKTHLKKSGKKGFSPLEIETLFWKASVDKPLTVEYANDMPGSAFAQVKAKKLRETGEATTVGETAWNMRGVSRSKGSLLRFMKEEIPGVTSPMVYIAMLFSWFAWHVEDHDLHSLNYMHMGAAKTWYGVPREAGVAFEDVIRVHGYGGEVNPLVTFATLGEKTTVMSPEVLIGAGIPCCRLVQNVGEFVVTFPGAYHSGFSHGFNCGEASNIATPEWLRFAKEAAIRRAAINFPPMVSHFQLLYALALTLCSRVPTSICSTEPRSSRLKEKRRGEGESIIKDSFVRNVMQNNDLLHVLLSQGSSCVLIPDDLSEISGSPDLHVGSLRKVKPRFSLGSINDSPEASSDLLSDSTMLDRNVSFRHLTGLRSANGRSRSMLERERLASSSFRDEQCRSEPCTSTSVKPEPDSEKERSSEGAGLLDQGLFSCITCGILSFACAAIIQPREAAARSFMSGDCNLFSDWNCGDSGDRYNDGNGNTYETNCNSRLKRCQDGLYDVPVQCGEYQVQMADRKVDVVSHTEAQKNISSLDLLAFAYGNSSDSDGEQVEPEVPVTADDIGNHKLSRDVQVSISGNKFLHGEPDKQIEVAEQNSPLSSKLGSENETSVRYARLTSCYKRKRKTGSNVEDKKQQKSNCFIEPDTENLVPEESDFLINPCKDTGVLSGSVTTGSSELYETEVYTEHIQSGPATSFTPSDPLRALANSSQAASFGETHSGSVDVPIRNTNMSHVQRPDKDACRKYIFCLEHAVEVEKQLRPIGGAHMLLLCHREYPKVEAAAKLLTEELGIDYRWKEILFKEANKEDREFLQSALVDEDAIPGNGDWSVKLGVNLYYSADLSRSPLYTKQMPYNSVIYKAFGCSSLVNSPMKDKVSGKQRKILVAGKWCGKVWMSNQVHPYLAQRDTQEEEDSIGFHARVTPSLRTSSKPERKAEISQQFERVTPTSKPSPKPERNSEISHQVERVTPSTKRNPKLERKAEISHQFERVTPSSKRSSKLERQAEISQQFERVTPSSKRSSKFERQAKISHQFERVTPRSKPSPKFEREAEISHQFEQPLIPDKKSSSGVTSTMVRKHGQKRKRKSGNEVAKRPKSPSLDSLVEATEAEDSSESDSPSLGGWSRSGQLQTPLRSVKNSQQCYSNVKDETEGGPSTRLRKRPSKPVEVLKAKPLEQKPTIVKKAKKLKEAKKAPVSSDDDVKDEEANYQCDVDGCTMGFNTKQELVLHKRNICSVKGCGKKFFSHKYLVQHRRVHIDDRPLKCPWKGCKMTFKWAWARTEHIRVHTGARPYVCRETGCGQTFRFVSDFSRHKRKTGHSVKGKV